MSDAIVRSIRLRKANTPLRDTKGYVQGEITHISFEKMAIKQKDSDGEIDTMDVDQCVFYFAITGTTGEPINIKHKCSTKLNGEKYIVKGKGRGKDQKEDYNKLTKTCLQLGLVKESELKDLTEDVLERVMQAMEGTRNLKVRFIPTLDTKNNLFGIGLKSLEVVK